LIAATLKWIFLFGILAHSATAAEGWRAVDGDSVVSPAGERIRIVGIDAPELKCQCPAECRLAEQAKERVAVALRGSVVRVERVGVDRYGRTLARVYASEIDLGSALVDAGLARVWDGKRRSWCPTN
jgi:micrococcal nuclease